MVRLRRRKVIAGHVAKLAEPQRSAAASSGLQIHIGVLVDWDDKGPLVDFEGNRRGRLHARIAASGPAERPADFARRLAGRSRGSAPIQREVVLLVDPYQKRDPVLLGYLTPLSRSPADEDFEARVDGRRIELEGRDEIVLRCGDASITLRRNGRIAIRGVDVETRAAGTNRIRGGTVDIN